MKIGGLIKSSMIDYPGKISCVVFTCGCNFICPYCHNRELIKFVGEETDTGFDSTEIIKFLKKRKGLLDGLVITGGEPTLQKNLIQFCTEVNEIGYPIKLDSNGSNPEIIEELISKKLIDYFAMDIKAEPSNYTPLLSKKNYSDEILKSIKLIMASGVKYEFRTTCAKPFVNKKMIQAVCEIITGADFFALQTFNPASVLDPTFFENQEKGYGIEEMDTFREIALEYVEKCTIR